jgi:hypothetical protein
MPHDVFISYSHTDKAIADAICHRLEAAAIRCWIAPRDVEVGRDWDEAILEAITETRILVVVFSAAANASRHIKNEVAAALNANSIIFPFRIEDVHPTGALQLHLGRTHWLDAITPPLEVHIDALINTALRVLASAGAGNLAPSPVLPPRLNTPISRQPRWIWAVLFILLALPGIASFGYITLNRVPTAPSEPSVERQKDGLEPVGYVQSVTQTATGRKSRDARHVASQLSRTDAVYYGEVLSTNATGEITIHFFDDSTVNVGSNSAITIDKFIYQKPTSKGAGIRG